MLSSAFSSCTSLHTSDDFFVHIIYSSGSSTADINVSLRDLLNGKEGMSVVRTAGHGTFLLWTTRHRTLMTTTNTQDDAFATLRDFMKSKNFIQRQICAM